MRLRLLIVAALAGLAVVAAIASTAAATVAPAPVLAPTTALQQVTSTASALTGSATGAATSALGSTLGSTLGSATSAGATRMTDWRVTATKGLTLKGTSLGQLAGSTPLHISVALQMRNAAALRQAIAAGTRITPAEFAAGYGASEQDAQAVATYLTGAGFTNVATAPNRLFVTGDATAAQAEAAFDTTLQTWNVRGETLYANATPAQVPADLTAAIAVLGLNDAAKMSTPLRPTDTGAPNYLTSYTPQGFWQAYDATSAPTGSATPIAIFAEGDVSGVVTDLRAEETANGLDQVPVTVVPVGLSSTDTAGADEWDMDTQYSTGMAATVSRLYIYDTTSLTDADITLEFNRFATDNLARAGSASFGECEYQAYLDGSMVAMDQVFNEAAAQGQTVFASSGDTGGFCPVVPDNGVPAGAPDVNYPASSPYVVSVGGTTLLTNSDGSYDNEAAWVAGGGGPSVFEYQPAWQGAAAPPTGSTCVEYIACAGKTLPDIAMDADPESGASVYVGGSPQGVGGTSLASPLALGVWARLESAHGNGLGFAAPALYAASGSAGYHDITLGDTGPYPATPGWDFATGLGTFDVAQMVDAIVPPVVPPPTLAAPACTSFSDRAGDASPSSLDVLAGGFTAGGSTVTGELLVQSLSDGPGGTTAISGAGDVWYLVFTVGGTRYFLEAEYPGSVDLGHPGPAADFSYGQIGTSPTGGDEYTTLGAAMGNLDPTTGVITISAPASVFGLAAGATLGSPSAATFESVGTPTTGGLLETADTAGPGTDYTLGSSCTGASSTSAPAGTSTSAGASTSADSHASRSTSTGAPTSTAPAASTGTTTSSRTSTAAASTGTSALASIATTSGVAAAHVTKSVRAHGVVRVDGRKGTATFSIRLRPGTGYAVLYLDGAQRLRFHSLRILQVRYGPRSALLVGIGILNGRRVHFTARAIDRGARGDVFRIAWTHGRSRGGKLVRGSVVVS